MKTYVIADIAGRYDELKKLLDQFEQPCQIVCVGDTIDRGSQSKEVVEYLMAHPEIIVIFGNHEAIMLEANGHTHNKINSNLGDTECWLYNGGRTTLKSFGGKVPDDVLDWVANLPLRHEVEIDGKLYLITHAPVPTPEKPWYREERPDIIWNRYKPKRDPKYALQIYGHNSCLDWIADNDGTYAVCIDDCKNNHLTALELPTLRILHQAYES